MTRAGRLGAIALAAGCGGLGWLVGPWAAIVAALGLAAVAAVLAQPFRGFVGFALIAPVIPWTTVNVGVRVTLSEALLLLTWGGLAWQACRGRAPAWPQGDTERAMRRFMAWSVVPMVAGQFVVPPLPADGNGPVNWVRWVLNLSVFFLVPLLLTTPQRRRALLDALVVGFALLLALSLGAFVHTPDARAMIPLLADLRYAHPEAVQDIFSANYARMASPWVHPNSTGGALLLGVPVALFHGVAEGGWRRVLGLGVALGGAAGVVLCGSRGALLCLGWFAVWLAWRRVPYAGRALLVGGVLAAAMLLAYAPARERLLSLGQGAQDASTSVRFEEYAHFHEAAERYPLGLGFKAETPATGAGVYGISNLWLNYWYKLGLPGMLLFMVLTRAWWREVRIPGQLSAMKPAQALHVGTLGAVLAALLTGFIDHYFSFTQVLIALFWLVFALSLQQARQAAPLPASPARP
ncbi:MAG: hypothetical protein RI907_3202 [Pseudomonadota bacterium]|jgi:hypothetical protein